MIDYRWESGDIHRVVGVTRLCAGKTGKKAESESGFADLVSAVTDSVIDEVTSWQNSPLERSYAQAVIPFFAFPAEVRKIIYTTNAIESLNASVRKAIRNKRHFLSDQTATKLRWLALRNIAQKWKNR
jgi:transposase-like protein